MGTKYVQNALDLCINKTWVIYDVNPIYQIKSLKYNTNLTIKDKELILLLVNLCDDYYRLQKTENIDLKLFMNTIKSIIKKITPNKLLKYIDDILKKESLKYIFNLFFNENIESFEILKQII